MPVSGIVPGIGRVRIIAYIGDGYFRVVDSRDNTRLLHRMRLTFLSS